MLRGTGNNPDRGACVKRALVWMNGFFQCQTSVTVALLYQRKVWRICSKCYKSPAENQLCLESLLLRSCMSNGAVNTSRIGKTSAKLLKFLFLEQPTTFIRYNSRHSLHLLVYETYLWGYNGWYCKSFPHKAVLCMFTFIQIMCR